MTDNGQDPLPGMPEPGPEPSERGRYAVYPQPDGGQGIIIARTTGLCPQCAACGCGTPQEPVDLSAKGLLAMAGKQGKLGMLKVVMGRE